MSINDLRPDVALMAGVVIGGLAWFIVDKIFNAMVDFFKGD